ncbi:TPA: AI-2E family transporter [Pseudomonas putida]|uniref:AI-2E family transporter n=1 Tax=Pseudomonas TaxID=286 RepID=UPI000484D245|nr:MULTISPECIES: AI-2E family transporter [Pseudomonas]MDD2152136.1 AI-2E family transporter [Pseudomonas putida]RAS26990.1 putative PurR-regulated permease PerM [Pseudomonas sp. URMO17WK12:I7]SMF22638.1 Predicted PurR-regulated permease PerM [Pseudomonas sp. URMO17WK12:I5]HDS1683665.1 AI-2E family transporter [Pseudomonas putida]
MTFTPRQVTLASLIIVMAGLLLALPLKLLPSLLAGLLVFELVNMLTPRLQPLIAGQRARWLAVALLGTLVVSVLTLLIAGAFSFLLHEAENPGASLDKFMGLVERARSQLPPFIEAYLPASAAEFKVAIGDWIKSHLSDLQLVGKGMAHMFVTLLIGMILGAIIALQRIPDLTRRKPLAAALFERLNLLVQAFRNIVFAQIKISLLNTTFTGIFLVVVMPLFGVHLPLAKTLIVLTFLLGLLPVIGNLMSNTLITIVGLSLSIWVAAAALGYLIVIHKVEYFLNAKIVGGQISAKAWELLLAMLVFEAAFGLPGVIAGPVYYAYLKSELRRAELV